MTIIDVLKSSTVFRQLNEEQWQKLASIASVENYPAGTVLYKEGDPAAKFYIVEKGKIILDMKAELGPHQPPMQFTVDVIAKGDAIGWSVLIEPHIYTLSALCIEDTKLIGMEAEKLRGLLIQNNGLGFEIMKATAKLIASRLKHTRVILIGERAMGQLMCETQYA
jgi:CRP/FNR family cyclic AMP-dependent transcriptional regulator